MDPDIFRRRFPSMIKRFKPPFVCSSKNAILAILCVILLGSCASRYFSPLPLPGEPLKVKDLGDLPYRELWQGFVFNGEKVGFVHLKIEPLLGKERYKILSEAHMRIRFLGMDKKITMKSEDVTKPDLSLVSFRYEQSIDEKTLMLDGNITDGNLNVVQRTGGDVKTTKTKLTSSLYPASVINLYPVLQGMKVGASYQYPVYDPQTQSIVDVSQRVITFEESKKLDLEPAYKLETRMLGHDVSSWINPRGETIFELGMGGVLITYRETEERAKSFLAEASLNKKDLIFDFSLIKTDKPVTCPRKAALLEASIEGISGVLSPLRGPQQEVLEKQIDGKTVMMYSIHEAVPLKERVPEASLSAQDRYLYLASSNHIESDHPEIRKVTEEAVKGAAAPREKVERLIPWVSAEVKDDAVDSFSALEVLHNRKGECQAHTMLYTAMARAAGIPTRLVGGIVYMEGMGFLYHAWAESYLNGWIAVDPTFNQVGVDATHIKLVEGHDWISLLQLGKIIGQIKVRIIRYACGQ
jgi:hypothetical protein